MIHRLPAIFIFLGTTLQLLSGCALATKGLHQSVSITSSPAGATVLVDGREAGVTPLVARLPRSASHRVELHKPGFATGSLVVRAQPNEFSRHWLRFGLDVDLGATNDLAPSVFNLKLVPLPRTATTYSDAYERMSYDVLAADTLHDGGSISDADHRYMIERIIARFAGNSR